MKMLTVFLFVVSLAVSARPAAQTITLSGRDIPLQQVFSSIKKQTGFLVLASRHLLSISKPVSLDVADMPLEKFLAVALRDQPLDFSVADRTIFLSRKSSPELNIPEIEPLPVTGKVTDTLGNPIQGVSVRLTPGNKGTATNAAGIFTIAQVDPGNYTLEISLVGHLTITRKIVVFDGSALQLGNFVLRINPEAMKDIEIISTGYQTLPKERVTGSFSTLSARDLEQQRLSSLGSLLEGRIPGYSNGLIRGTTTMQGLTAPLYVIDGFPVENTNYDPSGYITDGIPGLNLEDIETITVLKDAAAASIYGARAANGVIVIITKKAKRGRPQISVSSTFTVQPYRYYTGNLTSSADLIAIEKEWGKANPNLQGAGAADYATNLLENVAYQNQGINAILQNVAGTLSTADLNARLDQLGSAGFQYYDEVEKYSKRNPFYQQYNVSIGTSTERNSFYSSVTYRNNKFEDKYKKDESFGLNLTNKTEVTKWLSLELNTYISYKEDRNPSYNTLFPGFQAQPYDRLINSDGSYFTSTGASRLSANSIAQISSNGLYSMDITPLQEQAWNLNNGKGFNNRTSLKLNAKITDWLFYSPTFQYEYATDNSSLLYNKNSFYVRNKVNSFASSNGSGEATFNLPYGYINYDQNQVRTAYNFRQQFNIDKEFAEKSNLSAIVGTEIRNTKLEYKTQYLYDYDPQVMTYAFIDPKLLAGYPGDILGGGYFEERDLFHQQERINRFVSVYANAGYTYDDKYLLTGSVRWDQSNLWGTSSKYQKTPIWSLGAGWNISRESFMEADWINLLKLRISHGIGGNVYSDNAPFLTAYYYQNYNVGGLEGGVASRPNPLLSWEKTRTTNAGIDFAFFRNSISGSVDYYYKQGTDLLANTMGVPTEGFGYSTYSVNNGEMANKGIELSLAGDIIRSRHLRWNLGMQYAFNRNKVTYVNVEAPVYFLQLDYPKAYPRIGNPYNAIYSYKWAGLSETGLPQVYNEKEEKVTYSPGTLESIIFSGSTVPEYSGSFSSSLEYKNFSFSFLLTFEGGHSMRNTFLPMLNNEYNGVFGYVSKIGVVNNDINDRWRKPGDENRTNVPRAVFAEDPDYNSESYSIYQNADINVLDATNLRMRNMSLAYKLPSNASHKLGMQNVRFQFNVENAFTIAKSRDAKYLLNGYMRPNYVWGVYLNF